MIHNGDDREMQDDDKMGIYPSGVAYIINKIFLKKNNTSYQCNTKTNIQNNLLNNY